MSCIKQLTRGDTGNLLGHFWERVILLEIKNNARGIFYYYAEGGDDVEGCLNVRGFQSKTLEIKSIESIISDHKAPNTVIHCPNAEKFDFVIFDSNGESHGFQVSIQETLAKCRKSQFYATKICNYKYIVTPEKKNFKNLRTNRPKKCAYETHNLRIVVTERFVRESLLKLFL